MDRQAMALDDGVDPDRPRGPMMSIEHDGTRYRFANWQEYAQHITACRHTATTFYQGFVICPHCGTLSIWKRKD